MLDVPDDEWSTMNDHCLLSSSTELESRIFQTNYITGWFCKEPFSFHLTNAG
jgi:hypothetical protein